jgi:hypothetical protein
VPSHPCQDPAEADEPEPPKPPRDTELDDDTLVAPPPPPDDETPLNARPDDPDPEELEHAIDWPVTGSWHRCGMTTAVVTTPPPSKTNEMAVDRLMRRA